MKEPCDNCEVLRVENRALQRALERAQKAYEQAAGQLRIQGALEEAQKAHEAAADQLRLVHEHLADLEAPSAP